MFIIVSGAAGVGKNTVIEKLLQRYQNIAFFQTCTTRDVRQNNCDSKNPYIYLTKEEFDKKIKNNELFEHEEIHGNFYGVLNKSLDKIRENDKHYIKDIGVLGQINLKRALKKDAQVVSIFLTAPKDTLIKRLKKRGDKDIEKRISRMEFELSYSKNYDYVVENITLSKTMRKVESIVKKHAKLEKKPLVKAEEKDAL